MTKSKEIKDTGAPLGCGNQADATGTEVLNARTFNFMGTDVRVVMKGDEPWFAANDVSNILGLSNPRSSLSLLDDDEKGVHTVDTLGGKQDVTIISEAGMYTLALRSRKPQAKPFRRWVTHEVLPAINRTGVYAKPQPKIEPPRSIDRFELDHIVCQVAQRVTRMLNLDIVKASIAGLEYRCEETERRLDSVAPRPKITIDEKGKSLIIPLELIRR